MVFAVAQFAVADAEFLFELLAFFLDGLNLFADILVLLDLFEKEIRLLGVAVEIVLHGLADRRNDPAFHIGVAEFVLRLGFEHRILQLDRDGADDSSAQILRIVILSGIFVDGAQKGLLERGFMRSAVVGILPVHERKIALSEVRHVRESKFERLVLVVDDLVETFILDAVFDQVLGSVPFRYSDRPLFR